MNKSFRNIPKIKKTLFLHIGLDKTGSTAIQTFLQDNYKLLKSKGYEIVGGHHSNHGHIYVPFMGGQNKKLLPFKESKNRQLHKAGRYIKNTDSNNFIMSFEGFYHLHQMEDRLKYFLSVFSECRIIVILYVRRRSDKLRSGIAENLKLDEVSNNKYAAMLVREEIEYLKPDNNIDMDYLSIIRKWQNALADLCDNNALRLRVYEKSSFLGGDLFTDFGRTIGLIDKEQTALSESFKIPENDPNPSLSPAAQYMMIASALLGLNGSQRRMFLSKLIKYDDVGEGKHSLIPDEVTKALDEKYLSDDKKLAEEFFGRSELFLDPPSFRHEVPAGRSFIQLISKLATENKCFD